MFERRTSLLSLLMPIAIACGCSGGGASNNVEAIGHSSEAITVCPGASTLEGIDVSEFQGAINWGAVKGSGRAFAIARVSDGTGHLDPEFAANWSGIKNAGMIRGVYQFFRGSEDGVAQANLLLSNIGTLAADDLPPVADVEVSDGVSGSTLVANLAAWTARIQAATGRTPMIYSAPGFWNGLPSTGQFGNDVLWVANWQVTCPDTPTPWTKWDFWQYADNGTVPGISGAVDLDKFNGTAAQLGSAGGGADWGASFVSQSFPLASTALTMTEGQTTSGYIELKNIGTKSWDGNTRLATTQPRDRASVFADSTWVAPNRAAAVSGTVAPGSSFKFQFNLHAPAKPGTYLEYFGLVQESVAWFSDPGQGGPPDNDIEIQITVVAPEYRGDFGTQSFPLAPAPLTVHQGDAADGYIELTNSGTKPWVAGVTKLAPIPRDKASAAADPSWLSPTRVSSVAADVMPGAKGRFPMKLNTDAVGDSTLSFGLVEESVTWFADAPLGGGPADDFLKVHLVVVAPGANLDAGTPVPSGPQADAGTPVHLGGDAGAGNQDTATSGGGDASSGGCSVTRSRETSMAPFAIAALALILARRRRGSPSASKGLPMS